MFFGRVAVVWEYNNWLFCPPPPQTGSRMGEKVVSSGNWLKWTYATGRSQDISQAISYHFLSQTKHLKLGYNIWNDFQRVFLSVRNTLLSQLEKRKPKERHRFPSVTNYLWELLLVTMSQTLSHCTALGRNCRSLFNALSLSNMLLHTQILFRGENMTNLHHLSWEIGTTIGWGHCCLAPCKSRPDWSLLNQKIGSIGDREREFLSLNQFVKWQGSSTSSPDFGSLMTWRSGEEEMFVGQIQQSGKSLSCLFLPVPLQLGQAVPSPSQSNSAPPIPPPQHGLTWKMYGGEVGGGWPTFHRDDYSYHNQWMNAKMVLIGRGSILLWVWGEIGG